MSSCYYFGETFYGYAIFSLPGRDDELPIRSRLMRLKVGEAGRPARNPNLQRFCIKTFIMNTSQDNHEMNVILLREARRAWIGPGLTTEELLHQKEKRRLDY